ncbi:MAG: patatin-like phospholipase family protein [Candidatus Nanopelagicales bacterium]|jgi:NTE family protein
MNTIPVPVPPSPRALVLGGGGSVGNAWLIGVLAGLQDGGLDPTDVDLVIGTSAGATAAAQMTAVELRPLLEATLSAAVTNTAGRTAPARASASPAIDNRERTQRIIDAAPNLAEMRRALGAAALELDAAAGEEWSARWRGIVASRLPSHAWPSTPVVLTAVDARTGDPVLLDRHGGVDLVDAVAASTSSGLPYRLGTARYLDGGYRTNADNADLAAGYAQVLVLSPFGGRSRTPAAWGTHLATQVEVLRAGGSAVVTVYPDDASLTAFGGDMMDVSRRPPAARAGFEQGRTLALEMAGWWERR